MSNSKAPWLEVLDGGWPGSMRLRVQGSSMWPTLRPGDQVTVEPVTIDDLRTGDWVILRGPSGLFLHRFLGFTGDGRLLAKGDGHRVPDAPWPQEALVGRAVTFAHGGRVFSATPSPGERARALVHRLMAHAWVLLRRVGLPLFLGDAGRPCHPYHVGDRKRDKYGGLLRPAGAPGGWRVSAHL